MIEAFSTMVIAAPPVAFRSMITGTLPFGFIARCCGDFCSPLRTFTG